MDSNRTFHSDDPPNVNPDWFQPDGTWMRAALAGDMADPFSCSPFWQLSLHEDVEGGPTMVVRETGDSVMAFAFHCDLFGSRHFRFLPLDRQWGFSCPLLGPHAAELLEAMLTGIFPRPRKDFPLSAKITGLRAGGPQLAELACRFSGRYRLDRVGLQQQCRASLDGGLDGYLSRRSGNHRKKLRRQARRAREAGISLDRISPGSREEAEAVFLRMLDVERRSWKGLKGSGMLGPFSRRFYGRLLSRLSSHGLGRVILARHEGRDIGFILGGMIGGIYRGQQFSFDEDWASFSIGNLLQLEQVAWLCEDGAQRYDMGPASGRGMAYKTHWTEEVVDMEAWSLREV